MQNKLYTNAVSKFQLQALHALMKCKELENFRLVGDTAMSLHRGHRTSSKIDLWTDVKHGQIGFVQIEEYLRKNFKYVDTSYSQKVTNSKSWFIGDSKDNCVKLEISQTPPFIRPAVVIDEIRISSEEDIVAMKMDDIGRGGCQVDYWDIHELMEDYSFSKMMQLHYERYPQAHNISQLITGFSDFSKANRDFTPVCSRGKHWEIIKLDLIDFSEDE